MLQGGVVCTSAWMAPQRPASGRGAAHGPGSRAIASHTNTGQWSTPAPCAHLPSTLCPVVGGMYPVPILACR